jgi:ABC-2 type transport system permease protein
MSSMVGTGALVRLALRRDRVMLPVWILLFVLIATVSAAATADLYPTVTSVVQAASSINDTPALVALYGRVYDSTSVGAVAMLKAGASGAALVAVLAILIVVRHTRAEEESGRLELVGAAVVGRQAPLTAALLVAVGVNLLLGLLSALGLIGVGLPLEGSFGFGLAWAGVGIAFAAVAAIAAQLTQSGRGAIGLAAAALGGVYLLRAVGDSADVGGPRWLSWLSPIGWGQQFRPYAGDRWWVLLITLAFAVAGVAGAYVLAARRDLGAGLLPDRPGPATAAASLRGPLALAWRQHRGALCGWAPGFLVLGLVIGNVASTVGGMLSSQEARDMITRLGGDTGLTDAFLAAELGFAGVIASAYGVQAALRLRTEETSLRAEPLLATSVGRIRWAASHIVIAFAGTFLLLLVAGLGAGLAHGARVGDPSQVGRVLGGALVQLPAAWVFTGVVVAAFGLVPRLVVVGWVTLVAFLLLGDLGPLLRLDQSLMNLSPYAHVPRLPGGEFAAAPMIWLGTIAAVLTVAGVAGFRRRDIG